MLFRARKALTAFKENIVYLLCSLTSFYKYGHWQEWDLITLLRHEYSNMYMYF